MKSKIDVVMESLGFEFDLRPSFKSDNTDMFCSLGYSKDRVFVRFDYTIDNMLAKISYYSESTLIGSISAMETLVSIIKELGICPKNWKQYSDDNEFTIWSNDIDNRIDISNML